MTNDLREREARIEARLATCAECGHSVDYSCERGSCGFQKESETDIDALRAENAALRARAAELEAELERLKGTSR